MMSIMARENSNSGERGAAVCGARSRATNEFKTALPWRSAMSRNQSSSVVRIAIGLAVLCCALSAGVVLAQSQEPAPPPPPTPEAAPVPAPPPPLPPSATESFRPQLAEGLIAAAQSGPERVAADACQVPSDLLVPGKLGVNSANPVRRIESVDASSPQLRLSHTEGSVYTDFQTNSAGTLIISPIGNRTVANSIPSDTSIDGLYVQQWPFVTTSGTFYNSSVLVSHNASVANGATDSGHKIGVYSNAFRNARTLSTGQDSGVLAALRGVISQFGHLNKNAGETPTTVSAYGFQAAPYCMTGTITNLYSLYIGGLSGGGTVTNLYSLYSPDSNAKMYHAGQVGIGTTTPGRRLDVLDGSGSSQLRLSYTSGSSYTDIDTTSAGYLMLLPSGGRTGVMTSGPIATFSVHQAGDTMTDGLALSRNGTYRGTIFLDAVSNTLAINRGEAIGTGLSIKYGGNVGIGTQNPDAPLDILGSLAKVRTAQGGWYVYDTSNVFRAAFFDNGTVTRIYGDGNGTSPVMTLADGNVGIGTPSPGYPLSVSSATVEALHLKRTVAGGGTGIRFENGDGEVGWAWFDTDQKLRLNAGAAITDPQFVMTNSGNVGIGTASPGTKLHLQDDGGATTIRIRNFLTGDTADQYSQIVGGRTSNGVSYLALGTTTGGYYGERMRISGAGNVGIGTGTNDPQTPLQVVGAVHAQDSGVVADNGYKGLLRITRAAASGQYINLVRAGLFPWSIGTVYNSSTFAIGPGNANDASFTSPFFSITTDGNVGIGAPNPQGKLDVNGTIYQRGGLLHADYVFEPEYELESIEEHQRLAWENKRLPAMPGRTTDEEGREVVELGGHQRGIVEELEKAHIYIEQLNEKLKSNDAKIAELEQLNERLMSNDAKLAELEERVQALLKVVAAQAAPGQKDN
jgi:hypothetical protein